MCGSELLKKNPTQNKEIPMKRFCCVTQVWGHSYTDFFLKVCLPSQLWPNNLVHFVQNSESVYRIYTTEQDAETIQASDAYATLSSLMPIEIKHMNFEGSLNQNEDVKYTIMNEMHRDSIRTIRQQESALIAIQPDFIFADGAFRHLLKIAESGKKAIMVTGLRLTEETLYPEILQKYSKDGNLQPISSRELVKLAMKHLHPDTQSLFWDTTKSNSDPSWLIWKVANQGLLVRSFHMHPMMIDPVDRSIEPEVTLDADYLLKACPNFDDIHVVEDSDDFVVFEASSMYQRTECTKSGAITIPQVARWVRNRANEHHREHARFTTRLHTEDLSDEWQDAEKRSESVIDSVFSIVHRRRLKSHNPTLSVLMINYNHADFLPESISSILAQSYPATEIIVLDDNSRDHSVDIIQDFTRRQPHVQLVRKDSHEGIANNFNQLLERASGDYVYFVFAGDLVQAGFFDKSITLLSAFPEAGICCSDFTTFNSRTNGLVESWMGWAHETPDYFSPDEFCEIIQGGYISTNTSIVKRTALLDAGGFRPELKWHSDWFALLTASFRQGVWHIPEQLVTLRLHESGYPAAERRNWLVQREVLEHLLGVLKSPNYRDVLPYFVRGSLLLHFGDEILQVAMKNPDLWDTETMMLIQESWWRRTMQHVKAARHKKMHAFIQSGNAAIKEHRLDKALAIFENLIREYPKETSGYKIKAVVATSLGKFDLARNALATALKLNPTDASLYTQLGTTLVSAGDTHAAEQAFNQALALEPNNREARMNLEKLMYQNVQN